jgi:hypothetical protein
MEVQDLLEVPIYISMLKKTSVEKTIEIKSPALQYIYDGNVEEAVKAYTSLCHEKNWERDFQFDLLMGFWLAIHCEEIELTKRLMEYDIYLRQLVTLALKNKPEKRANYVIRARELKTS